MIFGTTKTKLVNGCVYYVATDFAFSTYPRPSSAGSVVVNEVELLIDLDERVVGLSVIVLRWGGLLKSSIYQHWKKALSIAMAA